MYYCLHTDTVQYHEYTVQFVNGVKVMQTHLPLSFPKHFADPGKIHNQKFNSCAKTVRVREAIFAVMFIDLSTLKCLNK